MIRFAPLLLCGCATVTRLTGPGCAEGFDARALLPPGPVDRWSAEDEALEAGRYCKGASGVDEHGAWTLGPSGVPMRLTAEEGAELLRSRWRLRRSWVHETAEEVSCDGERVSLLYRDGTVELPLPEGKPEAHCAGMPLSGPYRVVWPAGKSMVRIPLPDGLKLDPSVQEPLGNRTLDLGGVRVETFAGDTLGLSFFESVGVSIDYRTHELTLYPPDAVHAEPDDEPVAFQLGQPLPDTSNCDTVTWDFRHRTVWLARVNADPPDFVGLGLEGGVVLWVAPTSPAYVAGLERGDQLISVNGGTDFKTPFTQPFTQPTGTRVQVTYRRGHSFRETTLTLARWRN
jgi:hypothetical protein